ncbi:MAG: dUTP diphosphatase [Candidatus Riflebacteria bacterium]|nr:dUTP diphosphatase [Candidatus Riflebacteria bacterium]
MKLNFKLSENGKLPTKADSGSVGYDLYAAEAATIPAHKWKLVSIGLSWQPESMNVEMQIRPRSGLAYKYGITVLNAPGSIDASFRGNVGVLLMNNSDSDYEIAIGDRIAQAVFRKTDDFELQIVDSLDETERGSGGFGSSGK